MTVLDFVGAHIGQRVTAPGGIGGECVDLANLFVLDLYNTPHVYRNAIDWARFDVPGFAFVPNGPVNMPTAGDLVVWGHDPGIGTGMFGHIAICLGASPMWMVTCDQNWPEGAHVSLHLHNYEGVLGWLKHG